MWEMGGLSSSPGSVASWISRDCHLSLWAQAVLAGKLETQEQTEMDATQAAFKILKRRHLPTPTRLAAPFLRFPIKPLGPAPQNRSLGFKERKTNSSG